MSLWKAYIEDRHWELRRCLHLHRLDPNGSCEVVHPLTLQSFEPGMLAPNRDGILGNHNQETDDFLRAIMDAAWAAGIRPNGFDDHANELKAVRYHLEDMRLLAKVRKP